MIGNVQRIFGAVVRSIAIRGPRIIASLVPGGEQAYDLCAEVARQLSLEPVEQVHQDAEAVLQAEPALLEQAAHAAVSEALPDFSLEEREAVTQYLLLIPEVARRSFQRAEDISGRTVPITLALNTPEGVAQLLPERFPKLRSGYRPEKNWELMRQLGTGGMGEVWLGRNRHSTPEKPLLKAFKFCTDTSAKLLLLHEATKVQQILVHGAHIGIVPLEDMDLECDIPWLKYEYISGGDLTRWILEHQNLPIAERAMLALDVMGQLASTVGYFHTLSEPIVHRDLKPSNILVERIAGRYRFRIADYGIARTAAKVALQGARQTLSLDRLPTAYRGACTPLYASPQMLENPYAAPDVRDDIYALGVIWYQIVVGNLRAKRPGGRAWKIHLEQNQVPIDHIHLLEATFDDHPNERPEHGAKLAELMANLSRPGETPRTISPMATPTQPVETIPVVTTPTAKPQTLSEKLRAYTQKVENARREADKLADRYEFQKAVELLEQSLNETDRGTNYTIYKSKAKTLTDLHVKIQKAVEVDHRTDAELYRWVEQYLKIHPTNEEMKELLSVLPVPRLKAGDLFTVPAVSVGGKSLDLQIKFAYIPAGKFMMGTPKSEKDRGDDEQQHEVILSQPFYMGVHPITVGQFKAFVQATNFKTRAEMGEGAYYWGGSEWKIDPAKNWTNPGFPQQDTHPVTCVALSDVHAFIDWLNTETGMKFQLPTEAQWEYACRAGTTTTFYFGNDPSQFDLYGWYWDNSERMTKPICTRKPNPWGLYDMNGMVWEWCQDYYGQYSALKEKTDPVQTKMQHSEPFYVLRGGAWSNGTNHCRSGCRLGRVGTLCSNNFGMRLSFEIE